MYLDTWQDDSWYECLSLLTDTVSVGGLIYLYIAEPSYLTSIRSRIITDVSMHIVLDRRLTYKESPLIRA